MIIKDEFLGRIRKIFGLNLYEAKVWTAILSRGVSTAGELSNIGDVPRSRTYDILESLEKKGFIVMKLGKPIKFIALKPDEVVDRVKKNLVIEAADRSKRLDKLKGEELMKDLSNIYVQGVKFVEPHELSGALKGRSNIYNHMDMISRGAEKNITIVTSEEGLGRKFEALKDTFEKAKKKGVKIRVAAPISAKNIKFAKELSKYAEVRHATNLDSRFALVDGKELLFMVLNDKEIHSSYDLGVWINTPFFAQTVEKMFDHSWEKMTPLNKLKVQ